jgi:hypothetical protein
MTSRSYVGLAGALALILLSAPTPSALKSQYHVRLRSAWPQYRASPECENGGEEVLDGVLSADSSGLYSGTFVRDTRLLFCGAHGIQASVGGGCALTLEGKGSVAVTGVVVADETSPSGVSASIEWKPMSRHSAQITGSCPAEFNDVLRRMYLTIPHRAEFPLTTAGEGPRTERLEGYPWIVELN